MTVSRIARHLMLAPLAVSLVVSEAALAQQQEPDPNRTVRDKPRPEYDPIGARAGSFRILPELTITGAYSDNVESADKGDEKSDFITRFRPVVELASDWSRHALGFELGSEIALHAKEDVNDYEDFFLNGRGTLDISRQTNLEGNAGIAYLHEDQADINNDDVEPFIGLDGGLALSHQFNRITMTLSGDADRVEFDNNDKDDENRTEYNALLRGAYEVSPRIDVFAEGRYNILKYDENQQETGDDQDSDGYEARFGAGLDLTSVLFGEAFFGYRVQNFDETNDDESGVSFGADLNWNISQLTSLGLSARRDFEASNQAGANSNFQTQIGVNAAHEILRNMIIEGSAVYENDDFRGDARNDDTYNLGVGATYWLNRNASLNAGYDFSARNSNQDGQDFKTNEVSIGLTLRL